MANQVSAGKLIFVFLCVAVIISLLGSRRYFTKPRNRPLFNYFLSPDLEKICNYSMGNNNLLPIIFVKSAVGEFKERNTVRKTWGDVATKLKIPVIFVLGTLNTPSAVTDEIAAKVRRESSIFRDLLVADFVDKYRHVCLKTLSFLFWYSGVLQRRCFSKRFLFSTDSDVIVFPENLVRLTGFLSHSGAHNIVIGHCWRNAKVTRHTPENKYYISGKMWPDDTFPHYCSGTGFLLSYDVPEKLFNAIPVVGKFNILKWVERFEYLDDVLYTGVLREKARVNIRSLPASFHWYPVPKVNKCDREFISSHNFKPPDKMLEKWIEFRKDFFKECGLDIFTQLSQQ